MHHSVLGQKAALNEGNPVPYLFCVQTIYPVNGIATPLTPGTTSEYTVPDLYGRPWAKSWAKYTEQGMQRPVKRGQFGLELGN